MFDIDNLSKTIYCNKRNAFSFIFKADEGFIFEPEDFIEFKVYKRNDLTKSPIIYKTLKVLEPTETIEISLTEEDTDIEEVENKSVTYWYEIELNNNNTLIGYDREGPKSFIVYPKGVDINDRIEKE